MGKVPKEAENKFKDANAAFKRVIAELYTVAPPPNPTLKDIRVKSWFWSESW